MAHRPDDVAAQEAGHDPPPEGITFRLVDVEPVAGLVAAVARFCAVLNPEVHPVMSQDAMEALSTIHGIMWRLEHANVERT